MNEGRTSIPKAATGPVKAQIATILKVSAKAYGALHNDRSATKTAKIVNREPHFIHCLDMSTFFLVMNALVNPKNPLAMKY